MRTKPHQEVECYSHPKTCVILKKEIQYKFPENSAVIARRWLDVKFIEKGETMLV